MSALDGQVDIFGEVVGGEDPPELDEHGGWACPECGTYWDKVRDPAENRDWHLYGIAGSHTYPPEQGSCRIQDLYLGWLHTRRDRSRRKSVKWEGYDLLAVILDCHRHRCTQEEIRAALDVEWDQS